jgi:hypothetical protein
LEEVTVTATLMETTAEVAELEAKDKAVGVSDTLD